MRGKSAEVLLDRLVVADIGQDLFEERQFRRGARHGQTGLGHQRDHPDGLQRYGLAAGVRAADQERAAILVESQRERDDPFGALAEHINEERMAGVFEMQAFAENRDAAVEIHREFGFGEDQIERRHDLGRDANGVAIDSEAAGQLTQDAKHFAHFFFLQADEFVVEVDGFERFEEQGLAGGTGPVNDAGQFAALPGNHRHDKALVANGDVLFLQHAFVAVGAQEALERFLNTLLLLFNLAAETMEVRAGAVENGSVGLNFALDFFEERAEVADARSALRKQGEAFGCDSEK